MLTRRGMNTTLGASLVTLLLGAMSAHRAEAAAPGQNAGGNATERPSGVTPLLHESIGDVGDADAFMSILTLNPKSSTPPHKHSGPVFAYVLEGSVENQVDPDASKTYNAGDYWYEPALHVHRIFGNPSDTQRAKILVFQLMPKRRPAGDPAK
jgi:quercetin dioxygenase-like cupin family protein